MNEILYQFFLSADQRDRLRVEAEKVGNQIVGFVVQYEALIAGRWYAVVRYDTSHGFAHKDMLHPDGTQDKQLLHFSTHNLAFTFAILDLKTFWSVYRSQFEKEM